MSGAPLLVVGGSGGIGRAICMALAHAGQPFAFTWRRRGDAAKDLFDALAAQGHGVSHWQLDLGDAAAVGRRIGEIDQALSGLGGVIYAAGPAIEINRVSCLDPSTFARVMQEDINGFFHLVRAAIPLLKANGGGSITAVTTTQATHVEPRGVLSAAPKAAIEMMVRAIAKEEAAHGIRANAVRAGWVDAGLGSEALSNRLSDAAKAKILSLIPMNRLGGADELAQAVVFLASRHASFITGAMIPVDGGQHL